MEAKIRHRSQVRAPAWLAGFAILLALSGNWGCAQGNCCSQPKQKVRAKSVVLSTDKAEEFINVYRYNGRLQCMGNKGVLTPDQAAKGLGSIKILQAQVKSDGLLHQQACGTLVGEANVFTIHKKDWEKARDVGYKQWLW